MSKSGRLVLAAALASAVSLVVATPVLAQQASSAPPASASSSEAKAYADMNALEQQVGHDKRAFVDQMLNLTPEQASKFWPIYDAYQVDVQALNKRMLDNVVAYARAWNANTLNDATADKLASTALKNRQDELELLKKTYRKARHVLPALKAAQYLQLESKLRALVHFQQAAQVPLAQ